MPRKTEDPVCYTMNFGGNSHFAAQRINELGWAKYLVQINATGGMNSVIIFVLPPSVLKAAQDAKRVW